ncbi:hypothetical protein VKT23_013479 [Stygiomarasmius scandens]|uniref:Uncharacterized protein n=1 Tax=Marasmiellus scandens TaxID=2682957 RepID=A0ABR1J3G6_9AGAR
MSSVPLLLESFPAPPTFIPSTPTFSHHQLPHAISPSSSSSNSGHSTTNPPPSRPPSDPLPPVPRKSRGSDASTGGSSLFPQQRNSRVSAGSRYSSYSVGSTRPDSVMSTASARSNGRSYDSHGYGLGLDRFSEEDAYGGIHNEHDEEEPEVQLTRMRLSISPMPPSPEPGASAPPSSFHFKDRNKSGSINSTKGEQLLSAVSMNDLPPSSDVDDDYDVPTTTQRNSRDSLASVSTASSIVILQSSLKRKKPKRISIGQVHHSSVYEAVSSPVTSPVSLSHSNSSNSLVSPRPPESPFLTSPPHSAFLLTRTPPTPLTPAFAEGVNENLAPGPNGYGDSLSPGHSPLQISPTPSSYHTAAEDDDDEEPGRRLPNPHPPTEPDTQTQTEQPPSIPVDPHAFHRELRSARSRSRGHRERLGMAPGVDTPPVPSTPNRASPDREEPEAPVVKSQPVSTPPKAKKARSRSPDIKALLIETRTKSRSQSRGVRSRASSASARHSGGTNTPRRRSVKRRDSEGPPSSFSFAGEDGGRRRASDGTASVSSMSRGRKTSTRKLDNAYSRTWEEEEAEERRISRLEKELDGEGSDSDSGRESKRKRGTGKGFGYDRVENIRDSVEDIFGEYLEENESPERMRRSWEEFQVEDEAEGDSDSSLDLHTPLPHLMLRQGLLSPHSKLLPRSTLSASASMESFASLATCNGGSGEGGDGRPGSVASMASRADSVMTKSGVFKDARDTPSRRLRHKDGRLLRGGLGLTTGLGWSDSEDEDAPSPFTRRVSSTISLSRKSSISSFGDDASYRTLSRAPSSFSPSSKSKSYASLRQSSSASSLGGRFGRASTVSYHSSHGSKGGSGSSKLSRSYSSRDLADFDEDEEVDELGFRREPGDCDAKGKGTSESERTPNGNGKTFQSQPVSYEEYVVQTPSSTSSSVSIPLPVTPKDYEFNSRTPTGDDIPAVPKPAVNGVGSGYQKIVVHKDKMLPPLPNPKTGSIRRPQAGALAARRQASAAARAATLSIATAEGVTLGTTAGNNADSTSTVGNSTTVTASTASSIPTPRKRSGSQSSSLRTSSSSSSLRNPNSVTSSTQSHIPPVPSLPNQPLRQLQLPRYSGGSASGTTNTHKQTAVPVPSAKGQIARSMSGGQSRVPALSTSTSMGSLRGRGSRTAPTTPVTPTTPGKPRTGTGMVYRSSGSVSGISALKLPASRSTGGI